MAARTPRQVPELQASPRIIHTALLAGALVMVPLVVLLRLVFAVVDLPGAIPALRVVAIGVMVVQAFVVRRYRERIRPLPPDGDENAWWNAHLGPALVIWALGDGIALLGSAFFFLAGDLIMLAVIAGGLLLLFLARPGRLMAP
jgi:hypothetical protein